LDGVGTWVAVEGGQELIMKISTVSQSPMVPAGLKGRAVNFRDILAALGQIPKIFKREARPDGHFSQAGPRPFAQDPVRAEESRVVAAAQVENVEVEAGELAGRIGAVAQRAVSGEKVEVAFNSGWLQGVTCVVEVLGQRVRCRFKSEGAHSRKVVGAARGKVAGRLRASGFELEGYEVGS
jgi:hypothetical protein